MNRSRATTEIYTFQKYKLHFVVRFSKPFDSMGGWVGTNITHDAKVISGQGDVGAFANYHMTEGEVILVKTGISYVSVEQARLNLDTEMNRFRWDFDAVRKNARRHMEQSAAENRSGRRFGYRPNEVLYQLVPLFCRQNDLQRRERQVC